MELYLINSKIEITIVRERLGQKSNRLVMCRDESPLATILIMTIHAFNLHIFFFTPCRANAKKCGTILTTYVQSLVTYLLPRLLLTPHMQ